MENEPYNTGMQPEVSASVGSEPPDRLDVAHVLFMDLVAFSVWPMEEQREGLKELQEIVRNTPQVRVAERESRLICLPTGDGMALVFFGDPIPCAQCALEISAKLKNSRLKLRMGINTGPVYRVADINAERNVAGGGINTAQRIMDAGDAGHILVSKSTADILLQLKDWASHLHDLGEHTVKHGVQLRFYSLYTAELGNPALPSRFQSERMQLATRQRRRMVAVVAAVLVVIVGLAAASRIFSAKRRRSVAVMGFRNITSRHETDWVSTDLTEGLRTQLASAGKLRIISGEDCNEIWKDLGLAELDSMGPRTLSRIHGRGADLVIVGSYADLPDKRIDLNVAIQDTATGETIDSVVAHGTEPEITQLIAQTGERLRTKMGLGTISAEKERQLALSQPSTEAAPSYSEGLSKLRAYEPMQARSFLERAVIIDPAYPFAHSLLAEAWLELGYDQKAKEEAKKAFELSGNLSFEDQTSIEARYRGIANDWPAATAAYQRLYSYARKHDYGNLDYGLKLAEVQRSAGKGQDALATLAALRKLPEGDDPRIDREEAEIALALGDPKRAQTAAGKAAEKAKATGARLLESHSLIWSCSALRTLGIFDKAKQACERARQIATEVGDKLGTARAVNGLANILNQQGDLAGAKSLYEEALALGREIGDQRDVAGALTNIGKVLADQGALAEANLQFTEAIKIEQEIGFKSEIPKTLLDQGVLLHRQADLSGSQRAFEQAMAAALDSHSQDVFAQSTMNLGVVLFERGDLPGAEKRYREALAVQKALDARSDMANTLTNLGTVLFQRGNLSSAESTYQEAIAIQKALGSKSDLASTFDSLADVLVVRANLSEAENLYREAISIQQGLGEKGSLATSQTGLANVLIERNQAHQAEATVGPAIQEFHAEKDGEDETMARLVLARALEAQQKLTEAEREISAAGKIASGTLSRDRQYDVMITSARVRAAQGGKAVVSRMLDSLRKVAGEAGRSGMPGSELEARLAIGEVQLAHGDRISAQTELSAVQKDASATGYLLIAQKAARQLH